MAVLVTGGTGFVGADIVIQLVEQGESVVAFDLAPAERIVDWFAERYPGQVSVVVGDVCDFEQVQGVLSSHDFDRIVHAAAITPKGIEREKADCRDIVRVHVMGTVNVFEAARSLPDLKRVIYVSSSAVYKEMDDDQDAVEDVKVIPRSLYSITKYASEMLGTRWKELFGLDVVSVRLASVYGPMERVTPSRQRTSLMHTLVSKAMAGAPIRVNGLEGGDDWIHGWDVGRAVVGLLDTDELSHPVYNIGSGVTHSVGEILELLRQHAPQMSYSVVDSEDADVRVRPSGKRQPLNVDRLRRDLDFELAYPLEEGLRQYVNWLTEGNP
jgi:UDP-glucose 4-epimerase